MGRTLDHHRQFKLRASCLEMEKLEHGLKGDPRRASLRRESSLFWVMVTLLHPSLLRFFTSFLRLQSVCLGTFGRGSVVDHFRDPGRLSLHRVSRRVIPRKWWGRIFFLASTRNALFGIVGLLCNWIRAQGIGFYALVTAILLPA